MNYATATTIIDYAILALPVYLVLVMVLDGVTRIVAKWNSFKQPQDSIAGDVDLPDYDELFHAAEVKFESKLEGQSTQLTCLLEDAPLLGQYCQLATPLACPVEITWAEVKPQVDYSTMTIRELKKLANAHNKALPKGHSSRIRTVSRLKKAQLIAALTSAA